MLSDNTRGAILMMGSMTAFTLNDACVKALGGDMPLAQLLALRGLATTLFLFLLARQLGALSFRFSSRDCWLIGIRSLAEVAAAFFFLNALFNMPIANATAILQALPLTVTLSAALFFREKLGWRRLTAISVGLAGVLLIVRPGVDGFNVFSLYALAAVVAVTIRDMAVRSMSPSVPSMTIALVAAFAVCLFGFGWSVSVEWAPMTVRSTLLLGGSIAGIIVGYLLSVAVMRVGEVGFVAPFRYTGLVVALFIGLLFFDEWPDFLTLIGAVIVVGTGVFTLWRQQVAKRQ